ncbi:MAG: AAA family ATPase [Betaproteobacteria bacterium]|nr:AAA family ATPase [Betaproteobacteria bacterium]
MLKSFTVENFYSFLEPVQIPLELNRHAPEDDLSFISPVTNIRASKCLAVVGANASGKTNFVHALAFLNWFSAYSFQSEPDAPIPIFPHFSAKDKATSFEVEFEYDRQTWRYCLKASRERVLHESLHAKPGSRFSPVFVRDWDSGAQSYIVKLNQKKFDFLLKEAVKVRPNASLISAAAQYGVELARKLASMNFYLNFSVRGRVNVEPASLYRASEFYKNNENIRNRMTTLLTEWDLGLSDVRIEKHSFTPKPGENAAPVYVPYGIHRLGDQEHSLRFEEESNGTQSAFLLLSVLLPALQNGGIAVIDEMEANLHPHMLPAILDLFFSPETNPHHAQIIFTTHSLEILNHLHKYQVVIVEKNDRCESEAWRLDSMEGVRTDDNLYAKYMAGRYGGVPRL